MTAARPVGEIIRPIFADAIAKAAELHGVQLLLESLQTDAQRKICIRGWLDDECITSEQARMLLETSMREAA